jgi:RNA polymerase sigma factor (TIGR02999 family)
MAMRNILVEHARRKDSVKHGGGRRRLDLGLDDQTALSMGLSPSEVLGLDAALCKLEREHPRQSRVVLLRYFAGMSNEQVADLMDTGVSTVKRDWRFARAWLRREMGDETGEGGEGGTEGGGKV